MTNFPFTDPTIRRTSTSQHPKVPSIFRREAAVSRAIANAKRAYTRIANSDTGNKSVIRNVAEKSGANQWGNTQNAWRYANHADRAAWAGCRRRTVYRWQQWRRPTSTVFGVLQQQLLEKSHKRLEQPTNIRLDGTVRERYVHGDNVIGHNIHAERGQRRRGWRSYRRRDIGARLQYDSCDGWCATRRATHRRMWRGGATSTRQSACRPSTRRWRWPNKRLLGKRTKRCGQQTRSTNDGERKYKTHGEYDNRNSCNDNSVDGHHRVQHHQNIPEQFISGGATKNGGTLAGHTANICRNDAKHSVNEGIAVAQSHIKWNLRKHREYSESVEASVVAQLAKRIGTSCAKNCTVFQWLAFLGHRSKVQKYNNNNTAYNELAVLALCFCELSINKII